MRPKALAHAKAGSYIRESAITPAQSKAQWLAPQSDDGLMAEKQILSLGTAI
jgi:hypothetical protein